jgi:tetratricopeptide (TPR) repeat protein
MAGYIYYKIGDLAASIDYYQKAVQEEFDTSRHNRSYQIIMKLQLQYNDYSGLLSNANKALLREPQNTEALYYAAYAAYQLKLLALAKFYIGEALKYNRKKNNDEFKAKFYFLQGLIAQKEENKSLAKASFKKAAKGTLETAAQFETALAKQKVETLILKYGSSELCRLANSYLEANAYAEAEYFVEKAVQKGENPSLSYRIAGKVYYKMGNIPMAKRYLSGAALYETDANKLSKIYETLSRLNIYYDNQEALKNVNLALKYAPKSAELLYLKGQIEYRLELFAASIATLQQSISNLAESAASDYYEAEKNPGNHCNLINHSSDKISLLLKPPFITKQKKIPAIT